MGRFLTSYGHHLGLAAGFLVAALAASRLASPPPRAQPLDAPAAAPVEGPSPAASPAAGGRRGKEAPYTVAEVKEGGTIRVTCRLTEAPPASTVPFNKDQGAGRCGHSEMPNERAAYDPATLGLPHCVVWLTDIKQGRDFDGELAGLDRTLDQLGCRYVPHVMLVRPGARVSVKNSDPVQHNVKAFYNNKATLKFNLMSSSSSLLPPTDDTVLTRSGTYLLFCDIHLWMTGYIRAVPHPYHAVTGPDGTATITGVPPGTYTLACWHPGMLLKLESSGAEITGYTPSADFEEAPQTVTVPAGGTVEAAFAIKPR